MQNSTVENKLEHLQLFVINFLDTVTFSCGCNCSGHGSSYEENQVSKIHFSLFFSKDKSRVGIH